MNLVDKVFLLVIMLQGRMIHPATTMVADHGNKTIGVYKLTTDADEDKRIGAFDDMFIFFLIIWPVMTMSSLLLLMISLKIV